MSWRVIVIKEQCKLSYKDGYLLIRNEEVNTVHLSEIGTIIVDTTMVSITSHLMCELINNKIKIVFCDERHMPISELVPYYGAHNTSKKVMQQIAWDDTSKKLVWTQIVKQKIKNQANLLKKLNLREYELLLSYIDEIEIFDITNREGHAAKVYFNALFGMDFKRDLNTDINGALDYGYSIILSTFSKEITKNGYLTQLGICHKNEFNYFNFASDLMEPFRIIVDECVYLNQGYMFDKDFRISLIDLLNKNIIIDNKEYFLSNAIELYVKSICNAIEKENINLIKFYEFV